jgi:hypothetical protein
MSTNNAANSSRWMMVNHGRPRDSAPLPRGGALTRQKREAQSLERQSATADYDAARQAHRTNMERLKALRLARDAADALCPPADVAPALRKGRTKKAAAGSQPALGSKGA